MTTLKGFWLAGFILVGSLTNADGLPSRALYARANPLVSLKSGFCRLELLSLGLQSLARREGVLPDQVSLKAFIDGTPELSREELERMGATEVAPFGIQGHYVVRGTFSTLLDLTNHENVRFIQEVPGSIVIKQN